MGNLLQKFLMASYLYYECDYSPMTDAEFDLICATLLLTWDTFEHPHKHLVIKEDLICGSGYAVTNYPLMVKSAALAWKDSIENEASHI